MRNLTLADRLRADIEAAPTHLRADLREAAARIENDLRYIEYIEAANAEMREALRACVVEMADTSPSFLAYPAARAALAKAEGTTP